MTCVRLSLTLVSMLIIHLTKREEERRHDERTCRSWPAAANQEMKRTSDEVEKKRKWKKKTRRAAAVLDAKEISISRMYIVVPGVYRIIAYRGGN